MTLVLVHLHHLTPSKGAPETGDIPGAVPKPTILEMGKHGHLIHEYGPTTGIQELRAKVADYYNDTFRTKKESKYTKDNICIVPGGRAGLSRVASVISPILLGYQLPEYAAYEPMCVSLFSYQVALLTSAEKQLALLFF